MVCLWLWLLNAVMGNPVTFTAYERASVSIITATYKGVTCTIAFNVVEPNGVTMEQVPGTGVWHRNGFASAGFLGRPFIMPNDVSFINVEIREQVCTGTGTGFYSPLNGIQHSLGTWLSVGVGTDTKPNVLNGTDIIKSGSFSPPFSVGAFIWPIPWEFRVSSGSAKVFTTVSHQQEADAQGKVTISKGGVSKTTNANDPDSDF